MLKPKLKTISVPPDGGWGWVVCFAYALSNILIIPIMQSFGLIFHQQFLALGLSATDTAVIINVNSSFGMMMGLVNGSLLKKFGYRKMAIVGGLLVSGGVILTAFARTFEFFFISYGLITSLGFGLSMAAFSLALNSYFHKRRSRATGFAMTLTGIGPIVMPLFISYLLDEYNTTGCVLIIGGMALNTLVAGLLLQPLKWHMKQEIPDQEMQPLDSKKNDDLTENLLQQGNSKTDITEDENVNDIISSTLSIDHDVETKSIYGFETPLPRRKISQSSLVFDTAKHRKRTFNRSLSQPYPDKQLTLSVNSINSMKSVKENNIAHSAEEFRNIKLDTNNGTIAIPDDTSEVIIAKKSTFVSRLVKFFDLNLLKDPIYLNLMFGMSLAICAEINFSLLTPFILSDFHFPTHQIAKIMSIIAASDIFFRFWAPFIADWLHIPPKIMYMFSLVLLIMSRTALIFVESFSGMIMVAICLGVAKGFRTVFMSLLIPSYVPIEKLASASGMQMVLNGIINIIGGPLLGVIRDVTGSYDKCIIVINFITVTTLVMWTTEIIFIKLFKKN